METPNLAILSNGEETAVVLNGVVIGSGIRALEFKADGREGILRLMDISIEHATLKTGQEEIEKIIKLIASHSTTDDIESGLELSSE